MSESEVKANSESANLTHSYLYKQRKMRTQMRWNALLAVFTAICLLVTWQLMGGGVQLVFWCFLITVLCAVFHLVRCASQEAHHCTLQTFDVLGLLERNQNGDA